MIKRILLLISLILAFELIGDLQPSECHAGYDSKAEFYSKMEYDGFFSFLFTLGKAALDCVAINSIFTDVISNTCIPRLISSEGNFNQDCDGSVTHQGKWGLIGTVILLLVIITAAIGLGLITGGWGFFLIMSAFAGAMLGICLSAYVLAPHEYINEVYGYETWESNGTEFTNRHPQAVTDVDVPFFYNCIEENGVEQMVPDDIKVGDPRLDKHYGNMQGPESPYCQSNTKKYALNMLPSNPLNITVGSIILRNYTLKQFVYGFIINKSLFGLANISIKAINYFKEVPIDEMTDIDYHKTFVFDREGIKKGTLAREIYNGEELPAGISDSAMDFSGYYRLHRGKIQLCIAYRLLYPMINIGCTYVAPPIQKIKMEAQYSDQTRCKYFLSSRSDLNSLGRSLTRNSTDGDYSSVALFLQSDLHIMSTVVGCIQDLLTKVVIGAPGQEENSFLSHIQKAMRGIVLIVLVLYISLLGIKIMSAPQPPQMGEAIMYIVKFAFVIVLSGVAGPQIWYSQGGQKGMYPLLLESMDDLSNRVLQSANKVGPVDMCYLDDGDGKNILSNQEIPTSKYAGKYIISGTESLNAQQGHIKMTVWDYIDCKLINYLNLNSCKYNISGMISLWMITACLYSGVTFLLSIVTAIFAILLFATMMRFVHLSIVSMFALTILVLVSPIMACFLLFEATKQTFQSWFKMILGYLFYPALIFSFLALMIATFDSIFYGAIPNASKNCLATHSCTFKNICGESESDNNSIYCTIGRAIITSDFSTNIAGHDPSEDFDPTMCKVRSGSIMNALTERQSFEIGGVKMMSWSGFKTDMFSLVFEGMVKMLLFAILFYYLINALLGFVEQLLSLFGISGMAKDYIGMTMKVASAAVKAPITVASKAYSAASSKKK